MKKSLFLLAMSGLAGILYGLASGNLLSVAMPYFEHTMTISPAGMSTLVASFSVVAIFFGFAAGPLAEWIGRRTVLVLAALVFVGSTPVIAWCGQSFWTLFTGLGLQGVSMGLIGTVAPLYLAESLPDRHRGKGTALFQLFLILGIVFSGVLGVVVASLWGAANELLSRQMIFWIASVPAAALLVGGFFLPESKVFLEKEKTAREPISTLFSRRYVVPFLIVLLIVSCNKLCGLPLVLCYSVKIFNTCGLEEIYANWADVTFKTVMFAMTALACVLVDLKGRKYLLRIGTLVELVAMGVITVVFFMIEHGGWRAGGATGLVTAAAVTVFIAGYSIGPGVCVWLVMTEVLPTRIRAIGMSFILLMNHFISSAQQWTFLPVGDAVGFGPIFLFSAVFSLVYYLAVEFGMPETKGMELAEIEKWYQRKSE